MKADPTSGTPGCPGKETASEPDQVGTDPFAPRRNVAVPENGAGGTTVAVRKARSNRKREGLDLLATMRRDRYVPDLGSFRSGEFNLATALQNGLEPQLAAHRARVKQRWDPPPATGSLRRAGDETPEEGRSTHETNRFLRIDAGVAVLTCEPDRSDEGSFAPDDFLWAAAVRRQLDDLRLDLSRRDKANGDFAEAPEAGLNDSPEVDAGATYSERS